MKNRITVIGALLVVFITAGIVLAQDEKPSGQSYRGRIEPKFSQSAAQRRPKELDRVYSPNNRRVAPGFGSGRSGQNFGPGRGGFDPRSAQPGPGGEDSSRNNATQRLEQQMAQIRRTHENSIRELEGIKKVALAEKAEKTVAIVQKLIDKKNAEFQKTVDQIKEYRDRMQERLNAQQQSDQRPEYPKPSGKDNPRTDKQKKTSAYEGEKSDRPKAKGGDKKADSDKNKPKKTF